ncbi:MAG: glycosyltransferase, partial [Pseudonocardiaceae bacterium]
LVRLARRWRPDLIVHDATCLAGAVAGAVIGVPTVSHLGGSPVLHRMELQEGRAALLPRYSRLFARFGVEPRIDPTAWVDPCPPSMALSAEGRYLPVRFVPSDRPRSVPGWLLEPPALPRVCVRWSAGSAEDDVLRQVMAGVGTLDAEIVLAGTAVLDIVALDTLPAPVRVADSAPLRPLLRTCDAVVHQGWPATALTAAVCGTPQLVVGGQPEQALTGDRLVAVGAGRRLPAIELPAGEIGADVVGFEVAKLLDRPAYRAAAQRLQAEIERQPAPAELVPMLADLGSDLPELSHRMSVSG